MQVFKNLWNAVSSAGIETVTTVREKREIRLLNRAWLIMIIIQSICIVSHLSHHLYRTAFLTGAFVVGLLAVHVLMHLQKVNVAKITTIAVINLNSIIMAVFLGAQTHVADFLLIAAIMPLYFFETKTRKYIFWGIAVSLVPYILFHYYASFFAGYALPLTVQLEIYKTTVPVMVFCMTALLYLIYHKNAGYENDVIQKEGELYEQKRMYERILEQIPIDIVTLDKELRYSYINASNNRGMDRNTMLGKTNTEYFAAKGWSIKDAEERERFLNEALEKEATVQMEEKLIDRLGNTKYSLKGASPIYSDNNDLLCLVGYSIDVTGMKEAEKKMTQYAVELEKKNEDMRNFVRATSHDLKTPLRNIASFLQLIERRNAQKLDDDSMSMIAYTVKSVKHLNQLINDIYQYSVADHADKEVVIADFNQLLDEALKKTSGVVNSKHAHITVADLPFLEVAPEQIIVVFTNLINNALKYNTSENPEVKINCSITADEYIFSVSDNGIGIADEYRDRIFGMFQRLHSAEEYDGTGMGLAICNKIIEKYGRKIWVESEKGKGSTFYFSLAKENVSPQHILKKLMPDYSDLAMAS
jgi:PAS domain S-box-containing protein